MKLWLRPRQTEPRPDGLTWIAEKRTRSEGYFGAGKSSGHRDLGHCRHVSGRFVHCGDVDPKALGWRAPAVVCAWWSSIHDSTCAHACRGLHGRRVEIRRVELRDTASYTYGLTHRRRWSLPGITMR